jgi:excisionase family DNA binding protein
MKSCVTECLSEWLTVQEVAKLLRVSRDTIYSLLKEQKIPGLQIGGQWRINRVKFEAWLNKIDEPTIKDAI